MSSPIAVPGDVTDTEPNRTDSEPVGDVYPTMGQIVRLDPRLDDFLAADARIEVLASGFLWSEGPIWLRTDPVGEPGGCLLFSDIPRNHILRWKEGQGIGVFLHPSGYTGWAPYGREPGSNGLTLDRENRLVLCEHGDRRVSRMPWDGGKITLADNYGGKRFNSPNDVVVKSDGSIYFTDPPYGLPQQMDDPRCELPFCGVFRVAPDGVVTLLTDEMKRPNGLAFSPDEKTLYVGQSDSDAAIWNAYPVLDDGTLGPGRLFFDSTPLAKSEALRGAPDGFKVDRDGNLWATGPGGVLILAPDATLLGRIEIGELTANCAFGGPDGSDLYITANMHLCRVRTTTRGADVR